MKLIFRLSATAGLLAFSGFSWATSATVSCVPAPTILVAYVNGINNDPGAAAINLEALRNVGGTQPRRGASIAYKAIYNQTNGFLADLEETLQLKASAYSLTEAEVRAGYDSDVIYKALIDKLGASRLVRFLQEVALYRAQQIVKIFNTQQPVGNDLLSTVPLLRTVPNSTSIILLGHSEGSLFANALFDAIVPGPRNRVKETVVVMSLASVAREVKGVLPTGWVTSTNDLVVNSLRLIRPDVLPGTVNQPSVVDGLVSKTLNHSMASVYLNSKYSALRNAARSNLETAFEIVKLQGDASDCKVELQVNGLNPPWTAQEIAILDNFTPADRSRFASQGTPGNTCDSGEQGPPLYSSNPKIKIEAYFYVPGIVTNVPYLVVPSNSKPCSSFMAIQLVDDPNKMLEPRYRVWLNATSRHADLVGTADHGFEYQVRFDSGDPFSKSGIMCDVGRAEAPFWQKNFVKLAAPDCKVELKRKSPALAN